MATVQDTRLMTVDDLMALGSDARVEVIEGEVITVNPVGVLHNLIGSNIYDVVKPYVIANKMGLVLTDAVLYILSDEAEGVRMARVPDVSFVRKEAIPAEWDIEKPFPGPPTLAVEVISPGDVMEEVLAKVREYLQAGSEQVWLVLPRQKELHQYRHDAPDSVRIYRGDDQIDVESLFPGLVVRLSAFFAVPDLG